MVKKFITSIIVVSTFLFSTNAFAGKHGGGIVLGDVFGLTYKYRMSAKREFDGHLGFNDKLDIRVRYLLLSSKFYAQKKRVKNLHWYWGLGGALKQRDKVKDGNEVKQTLLGATAPIGIRYLFKDPTVELFAEASANVFVVPEALVTIGLGVGIRFFFD